MHVREPNEIYRLVNDYRCLTLLITNCRTNKETSNHADQFVHNYSYDYIIANDGTFNDLEIKAIEFINELSKGDER